MARTAEAVLDHEAQAAKAKQQFVESYQGATLNIPTTFHHRPVIRAYKRTFAIVVRNWFLATNLSRTKLSDPGNAVKIQEGMLNKINRTLSELETRRKQFEAIAASDGLDRSILKHGNSFTDTVVLLGPVAMKFREVFLTCDAVLDLATLLYTCGSLNEEEFQKASYDVKTFLKSIDASVRNFRIAVLKRINSEGGARPGYNGPKKDAAAGEAPSATAPAGATEAASDAVPASTGAVEQEPAVAAA